MISVSSWSSESWPEFFHVARAIGSGGFQLGSGFCCCGWGAWRSCFRERRVEEAVAATAFAEAAELTLALVARMGAASAL
jgi:hypothetical protein